MTAILKTLVILFAIWYILKLVFRFVFPFAMRKLAERLMKKAQQGGGAYGNTAGPFHYQTFGGPPKDQQQSARKDEGKVRVDYIPPKEDTTKTGQATAGEFVDFEEIK